MARVIQVVGFTQPRAHSSIKLLILKMKTFQGPGGISQGRGVSARAVDDLQQGRQGQAVRLRRGTPRVRGRATNLEVLFARRQEVHKGIHVGRRAVCRPGEEDEVGAHLETRRTGACRDFAPHVVPDFLERDPENEAQRTKQVTSQSTKYRKPLLISIDVMRSVVGDSFCQLPSGPLR